MIKVLVIDDSALIRQFMTEILNEHKNITVVQAVDNPYKAVPIINSEKIDVISLDLEMPKMDGLTFLEKIMTQKPMPVVVCSSIAEQGSENAIKALELGAIEVITKPKLGIKDFLLEEKERIQDAILAASKINLKPLLKISKETRTLKTKSTKKHLLTKTTDKVIAIGASTGGTIVLRKILSKLPKTTAGIVVTQHMPELFTYQFSLSLDIISDISIKEAADHDKIVIGQALIAKGNYHMEITRSGAFYQTSLNSDPRVNRHRPAVDVMFNSIAENVGKNAMGILLTGMGKDGAEGLKAIKEAGGTTICQNEASCVVYGMPKAAVDLGAVDHILGIEEITEAIINFE